MPASGPSRRPRTWPRSHIHCLCAGTTWPGRSFTLSQWRLYLGMSTTKTTRCPHLKYPVPSLVLADHPARGGKPTREPAVADRDVDERLRTIIKRASAPEAVPPIPRASAAIPGQSGLFIGIVNVMKPLRSGIAHFAAQRDQYGDIHRVPFLGVPMVIVWDADEVHKILKNEDQVWSTAMGWDAMVFNGLDVRGGNVGTLLSLDFEDHRIARKLVQPAFTLKAIEGYVAILDRHFAQAIAAWRERKQIDFKAEVRTLLARTAGEIFTGIRDPQQMARVDQALSDFWSGMTVLSHNKWVSPTFRRARRGLATLLQIFLQLVPERRASGGDDLFSRMCQVGDADGVSDETLVRVFVTIMFGAFDTTSAALASMGYLLAKQPEWQDRLRKEAVRIGSAPLDVAAMKNMTLHDWAWKETLRLMPVNAFVPRRALREVVVGGHQIPAGALVCPANGAIGHHPKWWTNPGRFDPERFSPERAEDKRHPGIYNPFGAGAHACIGMQLANMQVKVFWHRLLRDCRFRLTRDYEARHQFTPMGMVSGKVRITLEPLDG